MDNIYIYIYIYIYAYWEYSDILGQNLYMKTWHSSKILKNFINFSYLIFCPQKYPHTPNLYTAYEQSSTSKFSKEILANRAWQFKISI